jgi:hypothetical protein
LYNAPSEVANVSGIAGDIIANTPPTANSIIGRNDWFDPMIGFDPLRVTNDPTNRKGEYWHTGSPFLQSPLKPGAGGVQGSRVTPLAASYLSFCMSRGCAQFIVEYAGDYLTQDDDPKSATYGQVRAGLAPGVHPDSNIDFYVDPATRERRIRWYGFPRWSGVARDRNGDPVVGVDSVVPLWELMPGQIPAPFERWGVGYFDSIARSGQDPTSPSYNYRDNWAPATEPLSFVPPAYVCAWSPDMANMLPKMLRITIAIDDPNGRLAGPQFYDYVFNLPQ